MASTFTACARRKSLPADSSNAGGTAATSDGNRSYDDVLASLRQLSTLPPLEIGVRIDVDMSHEPDINHIVDRITRLSEP